MDNKQQQQQSSQLLNEPYVNDLEQPMKQLYAYYDAQSQQELENHRLSDVFEVLTEDPRTRKWCAGDEYYDLAQRMIASLPDAPSDQQYEFMTNVFDTCIASIYGDDFSSRRADLMRKRNWKHFKKIVLLLCARRFGKTVGCAMAAALLMYVCPKGIRMLVFSVSQDVSSRFMAQVKKLFYSLPGGRERMLVDNTHTFHVRAIDERSTRNNHILSSSGKVNCLDARAATVQGNHGSLFWLVCPVFI